MKSNSRNRFSYKKRVRKSITKLAVIVFSIIAIVTIVVLVSGTAQAKEELCLNKYYKSVDVKAGETLWDIANENNDNYGDIDAYIAEVQKINNLGNSSDITAGMTIIVPYMAE